MTSRGVAREAFEDYAGEYQSAADFAELLRESRFGEGAEVPESLRYCIVWRALARDMALNGGIRVFEADFDEVHGFWGR